MTLEERLEYCKVCSKRKLDLEQGIVCGITGEKPVFETGCEDYSEDSAAVVENKKRQQSVADSVSIKGFLAFFVYVVIPLSIVMTLVTYLSSIRNWAEYGIWIGLCEVAFLAFYVYFEAYIIYGFIKRKPDAVFIAKYQLIVITVVSVLLVLLGAGNLSSLLPSIIWNIVFFLYLCFSNDVEDLIPKKTRKLEGFNKVMVVLSLVIPSVLFIISLF